MAQLFLELSRLYVYGEDHLAAVIQWGKPIIHKDYLKLLLRRDDVIPADHLLQLQQWWSSLTPVSLSVISHEPIPVWKPLDDYSHFFMRFKRSNHDAMLAVAELRWLASGGILSMDSNVNILEFNPRRQPERELSRNRASRVESVLPTPENVDAFKASTTGLLAALEE